MPLPTAKREENPDSRFDRNFIRRVFMVLLLAGFFALFVYALNFFMLVFGGILLGIFFGSISQLLQKKLRFPPGLALVTSVVLTLGSFFLMIWILAPTIYHQGDEILRSIEVSGAKIKNRFGDSPWGAALVESFEGVEGEVLTPENSWSRFKGFFSTTLGVLADVLIILITGIFLAADPEMYVGGVLRLVRPERRDRMREIMDLCYRNVRLWMIGKFASMLILGILFYIGLLILGAPLALALALISAFLAFVPNIGGYLSGIIAVLVAFTVSGKMAVSVLVLYVAIQFLEDYFLTPVINKKMIALPPALTLFWLVLLGLSAGILGLFLAAPLLSIVLILVREIYVKDHLEGNVKPRRWQKRRRPKQGGGDVSPTPKN